jgi:putative tricarboxylic transport membrane protein
MSKDLASALFWLSVAIFVCLEAFTKLKLGSLHQPGPGFFPFWGGVLFATLSLILLLRSLRSRERLNFGAVRWSALVLVLAALLIYLLFLEALGFVIVTFCFLLLLFRFGEIGWIKSAASSVVATSLAYALFQLWLRVQLPRGWLGI